VTRTDDTPLSDAIASLLTEASAAHWHALIAQIRSAQLGVVARGLPSGAVEYEVRGSEVGLANARTRDGKLMILAAADPGVYRRRYPTQPLTRQWKRRQSFERRLLIRHATGSSSIAQLARMRFH